MPRLVGPKHEATGRAAIRQHLVLFRGVQIYPLAKTARLVPIGTPRCSRCAIKPHVFFLPIRTYRTPHTKYRLPRTLTSPYYKPIHASRLDSVGWRRDMAMNSETPSAYPPKLLRPASSKFLMAGVAILAGSLAVHGALYAEGTNRDAPLPQAAVGQQKNIGTLGFADLVEQVRSAVVSVRVKIDEGQQRRRREWWRNGEVQRYARAALQEIRIAGFRRPAVRR